MRCWVVGVCLCLIVVTSGCQSFSQLLARRGGAADASRLMQGGTDALHDGRLGQAESLLSRAAQTRPRDPRIRENLAHALAGQGKLEQAIENMSRAVEKSHGDPLLNVQLGQLYLQAGRTVPASRQAAIALEQNRKLPEAWVLKAETELARNNLETALADFQRALGYSGNLIDSQMKVAMIQRKLGKPMRALSTLENLLQQYPNDKQPEPAVLLASNVLLDLQQHEQAIEILTAATNRRNATSESFVQLSRIQLAAGQQSQARLTVAKASSKYPDQSELQDLLAQMQRSDERVASVNLDAQEMIR